MADLNRIDLTTVKPDHLILYFGGRELAGEIDAETLGKTLIEFAQLVKLVQELSDPGTTADVLFDHSGNGSFWARIKIVPKSALDLWELAGSHQVVGGLVVSLVTLLITQTLLDEPEMVVHGDVYILNGRDAQVVGTTELAKKADQIKQNPDVRRRIARTFELLETDPAVETFRLMQDSIKTSPLLHVDRDDFPRVSEIARDQQKEQQIREIVERGQNLHVSKMWLQGSTKKAWQFLRNGHPISAPILDEAFLRELTERKIALRHGDYLVCDVRISQVRDQESGLWVNSSYAVVAVHDLKTPKGEQPDLKLDGLPRSLFSKVKYFRNLGPDGPRGKD